MSSTSTIVLKTPTSIPPEGLLKNFPVENKSSSLLLMSLWLFSSLFSASRADLSPNVTGITITFNIQDVLLIAVTAYLLHRGLYTRNIVLIIPWVLVTLYGVYYNHYRSILKMMHILKHVRLNTALPWVALGVTSLAIIIRIILTLRILQLAANLWYRKKLEKELYESY